MWRLEDRAEIEALAVAFRSEGDRRKAEDDLAARRENRERDDRPTF